MVVGEAGSLLASCAMGTLVLDLVGGARRRRLGLRSTPLEDLSSISSISRRLLPPGSLPPSPARGILVSRYLRRRPFSVRVRTRS